MLEMILLTYTFIITIIIQQEKHTRMMSKLILENIPAARLTHTQSRRWWDTYQTVKTQVLHIWSWKSLIFIYHSTSPKNSIIMLFMRSLLFLPHPTHQSWNKHTHTNEGNVYTHTLHEPPTLMLMMQVQWLFNTDPGSGSQDRDSLIHIQLTNSVQQSRHLLTHMNTRCLAVFGRPEIHQEESQNHLLHTDSWRMEKLMKYYKRE